eukprot:TRINITY_DN8996_c0_g1_i1.p1 TRINITY_DN8996_c0_g1~~TRINITY_DN8996_c0_g1_i1.p1  ORF type:complete len:453 (+),score=105.56 TRINITY_DN8996_c0_g1_i1:43-1401(+)
MIVTRTPKGATLISPAPGTLSNPQSVVRFESATPIEPLTPLPSSPSQSRRLDYQHHHHHHHHSSSASSASSSGSGSGFLSQFSLKGGATPTKRMMEDSNGTLDDEEAKRQSEEKLRKKYQKLIEDGSKSIQTADKLEKNLEALKEMIIFKGMPADTQEEINLNRTEGRCTLRGTIWKILLRVGRLDADLYCRLIEMGPSPQAMALDRDTARMEKNFNKRLRREELVRLVNASVHFFSLPGQKERQPYAYLQGTARWAGVLLTQMSELEAFFCYVELTRRCQTYSAARFKGSLTGGKLFLNVLKKVEPKVYDRITNVTSPSALLVVYANPILISFWSICSPYNEVIKLWDFFLAYGFHLSVIALVAQVVLLKRQILAEDNNPLQILATARGKFPNIDARKIIDLTLQLLRHPEMSQESYVQIYRHPFDWSVKVNDIADEIVDDDLLMGFGDSA